MFFMKFVVDSWMWILLALTSGGMLREVEVTAAMPKARPWGAEVPPAKALTAVAKAR